MISFPKLRTKDANPTSKPSKYFVMFLTWSYKYPDGTPTVSMLHLERCDRTVEVPIQVAGNRNIYITRDGEASSHPSYFDDKGIYFDKKYTVNLIGSELENERST
jgi:hypothetical protein